MAKTTSKYNTGKADALTLDLGKMPPQALDLEEAVLGAIMLEKDAVIGVLDIVKPDSFYKDAHQKIFRAIVDLSTNERPIDILTVTEQLKKEKQLEEVGGPYYIAQLTNRVASAANIEFHARIVQQKYIQRELIRITSDIQTRAFDESIDVNDLLDYSEGQLFEIAQGNIKKDIIKINLLLSDAIKQIEEAGKREDSLSGVPSGFTKLDRITSGWQKSDLIIVAARPSMGKTAFVLSMARNMAVDHKRSVAIFSLEMSSLQLVNRLISCESEIQADRIRSGKLSHDEWSQLESKIKPLENAPIFIDDTPAISIFELRAKCRRLSKQHNVEVIIIDYLQLMTGPPDIKGNREQEVSIISRSLKSLAKELNVPVIALSQLNRSVEMRTGNKRPQLSDLRESGAIEQDADLVCFIHRPEKYGILEDEEGNSTVGMAEIIVAKHRNGAIDDIKLRFRNVIAKFVDYDELAPFDDSLEIKPVVMKESKMNQESDFDFGASSGFGANKGFEEESPF
jgi:replicative DNA helicase